MKYTNADLTRWLQAANAALAENDLECVATSLEGRGEIRSPKGGIVTVWASGKVSAGGSQVSRDEIMSVMSSAELLIGHKPGATGGMLLVLPAHALEWAKSDESVVKPALKVPATEQEIMAELRQESALNRARRTFSSWSAKIEQAGQQRRPLDPIEWRRMEFQAVAEIAAALGL